MEVFKGRQRKGNGSKIFKQKKGPAPNADP